MFTMLKFQFVWSGDKGHIESLGSAWAASYALAWETAIVAQIRLAQQNRDYSTRAIASKGSIGFEWQFKKKSIMTEQEVTLSGLIRIVLGKAGWRLLHKAFAFGSSGRVWGAADLSGTRLRGDGTCLSGKDFRVKYIPSCPLYWSAGLIANQKAQDQNRDQAAPARSRVL